MDEAFEKFRAQRFGAYASYPVDAYTYFCAGWKARADEIERLRAVLSEYAKNEIYGARAREALDQK